MSGMADRPCIAAEVLLCAAGWDSGIDPPPRGWAHPAHPLSIIAVTSCCAPHATLQRSHVPNGQIDPDAASSRRCTRPQQITDRRHRRGFLSRQTQPGPDPHSLPGAAATTGSPIRRSALVTPIPRSWQPPSTTLPCSRRSATTWHALSLDLLSIRRADAHPRTSTPTTPRSRAIRHDKRPGMSTERLAQRRSLEIEQALTGLPVRQQ